MKTVVVTGATGLIGKAVTRLLKEKQYRVVVFSRDSDQARESVQWADHWVTWNPERPELWRSELEGVTGVIHLAGASVAGRRWTAAYKKEIRNSRVTGTRALTEAFRKLEKPPGVFVSGSAIGIYGPCDDRVVTETSPAGSDFLARVGIEWEAESLRAVQTGIRTVVVRTGVVLDPSEGALKEMKLPFLLYTGGPVLPGTQYFSWIHLQDEAAILVEALENPDLSGAVNATAPAPVTMAEFCRTLGGVLNRPSWLPVPGFLLRILKGEVSEVLTTGQRVMPEKLLRTGFQFRYPELEPALNELLGR